MKVSAKIFTIAVIAAFIVPVFSVLSYNIYIDPFQIIHKDFQKPTVFLSSGRERAYQRAGIINQHDLESVVIGHSQSMNYIPSKIEQELGWNKVFNIAINGRTVFEQSIIAKRCLSKHNIEKILWGVDVNNLMVPWNNIDKINPLKLFLYDNNRLNDLQFFLTFDLQKYHERKKKLKKIIQPENNTKKKEQPGASVAWYRGQNMCRFNRPVFVADKIIGKKRLVYNDATKEVLKKKDLLASHSELNEFVDNYKDNFSHNLLPIIAQNPQTEFFFILTAYPTLNMQKLKIREKTKTKYKAYFQVLKQFIIDIQHYDNAKVFGFDTEEFTNDLRLYRDKRHYHLAVNNYIVEQMAKENGLLTVDNVDTYLKNFDKKVTNYRLPEKWNPQLHNKMPKTGYLSLKAARLLIASGGNYSDEIISCIALKDTPLPNCVANIKKYSHHECQ